ncbi:hypothetical protein ACMGGS_18595 [Superficieibacter sp. BNK-5]|uniref:hypothetical protein n=1 Tax=Superficieibacter sp. BNK-5 TaxID=3376142 RepID=UPI0039BF06BC
MIKKTTALLALLPLLATASESTDKAIQKARASSECIAYLTMLEESDLTPYLSKVKVLTDVYKSSILSALNDPTMKDDGLFERSGVSFSNDFYAGEIFASSISDTTKSVRDSTLIEAKPQRPHLTVSEQWAEEALKRYSSSNCDLIE